MKKYLLKNSVFCDKSQTVAHHYYQEPVSAIRALFTNSLPHLVYINFGTSYC